MEKAKDKGNSKKNWKSLVVIGIILLCLLGASLAMFLKGNEKEEVATLSYTVSVKDASGAPIEEVYVALCAEDGTEKSRFPYVTNISGKSSINENVGEGYYIKVVGVPAGFKLDESIKYSFDDKGEVKIVLTEDDSVYVAQIEETRFMSFAAALSMANGAGKDVTIDLLDDITVKEVALNNIYGNSITINGNGKTITTEGGNNTFNIKQDKGKITFANTTIKHKNTGSILQITALANVELANVKIDATEGTAYNYCLINTMAKDGETNLTLNSVDVKMAIGTAGKDNYAAIIRTGNEETKTVNINMDNCNFDVTEAIGRNGIVVMKKVTANINMKNSTIKAGDGYAVWAVEQSIEQTMTMTNSVCTSEKTPFSAAPVKGYHAQIGNTLYLPLSYAFKTASNAKSDVTVKLIDDITIKTASLSNKNGKLVTVDGNGKTVTTKDAGNAFVLGNKVAFKNLTVNHKNTGSIFHATEVANITLTDVNMKATEGKTYSWALINLLAKGEGTTLDCTRVNATMAVESKGSSAYGGVIRTGNDGDEKTVAINLTDCNFDTSKATGRVGIAVMKDTKAVVNLKNTTIKTMDAFAIRSGKQDINWDNADTTLTSLAEKHQEYPVEWYLAKIGDVFYTFEGAAQVASAAAVDTKIDVVSDYTFGTVTINNKNGKLVTLNGNGKTLTTNGGNNAFVVGNNVALTNMTINHKNAGSAVQLSEAAGTISLSNLTLNATEGAAYNWALINMPAKGTSTLNMDTVNVNMEVAGRGKDNNSAIIRTGNEDEKTLVINLKNCNFDTTKATGRHGIAVMKKTTATINMSNTTIKTLDVPAVKINETSKANTLTTTACTLDSVTKEYNTENEPVKGYQAKIGDTYYVTFAQALKAVTANDTVIELAEGFTTTGDIYLQNCAYSVIIDGKDKTLTATGGNNTFRIAPSQKGNVTFKNMILVHRNKGAAIQVLDKVEVNKVNVYRDTDITVALENMTIDATNPDSAYNYALINLVAPNVTTTLNLTKVDVVMADKEAKTDNKQAIIRTGNEEIKNVVINVKDCNLNAAGASERSAIRVMKNTTATITIDGSTLRTMKAAAVTAEAGAKGTATIDGTNTLLAGKEDDVAGYKIKIGNVWYVEYDEANLPAISHAVKYIVGQQVQYMSFEDALKKANDATVNSKILLVENVEVVANVSVGNKNGKTITVDGAGKRITTEGGNHAFIVDKNSTVEFENMTVVHKNWGAAFNIKTTDATLNLSNMTIDATMPSATGYNWCIINMDVNNADIGLNMTDVTVDMKVGAKSGNFGKAIIRTGNENQTKEVDINLTRTTLNATQAPERNGISVMKGTTANITMVDSTIGIHSQTYVDNDSKTQYVWPINDYSGKATVSMRGTSVGNIADTDGKQAAIGDTFYATFSEALKAANSSDKDVTIRVLTDVSVGINQLIEKAKGKLVIDGMGHTIESTGDGNTFRIGSPTANDVAFRHMTLNFHGTGAAIQLKDNLAKGVSNIAVDMTDVTLNATDPDHAAGYKYGLINLGNSNTENIEHKSVLNLTRTNVYMKSTIAAADADGAIIRTGNAGDNNKKTVEINLVDSVLDSTGMTGNKGGHGIVIMNTSKTTVNLTNSIVKAAGGSKYAIKCNTTDYNKDYIDIVLDDQTVLRAGDSTDLTNKTVVWSAEGVTPNIISSSAMSLMSLEPEETKQLVLDVPVSLYDKLVALIKEFAETWGWHTGL